MKIFKYAIYSFRIKIKVEAFFKPLAIKNGAIIKSEIDYPAS